MPKGTFNCTLRLNLLEFQSHRSVSFMSTLPLPLDSKGLTYVFCRQTNLFLSAWSICKWARLCKWNREDCLKRFPVGILRTQAGSSSCHSWGCPKQRAAVAPPTLDVHTKPPVKRWRRHPLSASKDSAAHTDQTHLNVLQMESKFCLRCHFPWSFVQNVATGPILLQSLNAVWPKAQPAGFKSPNYTQP